MMEAFGPDKVGCGRDPALWNATACPQRFILPALNSNPKGETREIKEPFYYGGGLSPFYHPDLADLHGPDPRTGALASFPALWAWEEPNVRTRRWRRYGGQRRLKRGEVDYLRHTEQMGRLDAMCAHSRPPQACGGAGSAPKATCAVGSIGCAKETCRWPSTGPSVARSPRCSRYGIGRLHLKTIPGVGPRTCTHPGCIQIARGVPGSWSGPCNWANELHEGYNRSATYCLKSIVPWAAEGELNLTVVDFTPNYLCDADAITRIYNHAPDPRLVRFILPMRDPVGRCDALVSSGCPAYAFHCLPTTPPPPQVMRAFSEWSMFALGWEWDGVKNFSKSFGYKLQRLKMCNETLFQNAALLRRLPTSELAQYMRKCFGRGRAMMYPQLSMYPVCILHAMRYFEREQFLFLRYEDLMKMEAPSVIRLISRFTGLGFDERRFSEPGLLGKCEATSKNAKHPMSFSSNSKDSAELLAEASPHLERFFDAYASLLTDLVHPAFHWNRRDHAKRPLNATEKIEFARREAARKERRAAAEGKKKAAEAQKKRESVAWSRQHGGVLGAAPTPNRLARAGGPSLKEAAHSLKAAAPSGAVQVYCSLEVRSPTIECTRECLELQRLVDLRSGPVAQRRFCNGAPLSTCTRHFITHDGHQDGGPPRLCELRNLTSKQTGRVVPACRSRLQPLNACGEAADMEARRTYVKSS